ncbi:MAG: cellulose binding domain-containing protein [Bacteroidetes bacterium]|nr:cellulose binding domain-containing protein [Bacteroidota bacterium]
MESLAPYSHVLDKIISIVSASTRLTASRSRILAIWALFLFSSAHFASTARAQDVRVVHAIELNRDGRYTANVMVTNMTSTTIRNWTMTFRMTTSVESINHVGWSQFQGAFTVNGRGWTKEIAPGDVVWFTISGLSYNNVVEVPRNCFFNGTACVVSGAPQPVLAAARPDQMIVSAWIDKSDATTYSGYIAILNPTALKFPALWDLKFSTPSLLVELKEVIWSRSGSDYQVYGHAHTDYIDAGDFVLIPIRGVHTGTPALPSNCRLNGVACTFKTPDSLIETPWINVDIKMAEFTKSIWEGYIRIENPTNYELDSWTLRFDLAETITEMAGRHHARNGVHEANA